MGLSSAPLKEHRRPRLTLLMLSSHAVYSSGSQVEGVGESLASGQLEVNEMFDGWG